MGFHRIVKLNYNYAALLRSWFAQLDTDLYI